MTNIELQRSVINQGDGSLDCREQMTLVALMFGELRKIQ